MNPCPCGYFGDSVKPCIYSSSVVTKYQKRISGPLLDRIDIHIEVPRVEYDKLSDKRFGEPSQTIQNRVEKARQLQRDRFDSQVDESSQNLKPSRKLSLDPSLSCNADMHASDVRQHCHLDETCHSLMRTAMNQL